MRSSRRRDLDAVLTQFEAWRVGGRRRRIPEDLWRSALGLLDRYRASTICRRLVLNPSRFKQMRGVVGGPDIEQGRGPRRKRRSVARTAHLMRSGRRSASGERATDSTRPAFVELAPLGPGVLSALASPLRADGGRTATECRLVVSTSSGARLTVELMSADVAVIEAICRSVLGGEIDVPGPATR